MGVDDNRMNIAALIQTQGNVNPAIGLLLTNLPTSSSIRVTSLREIDFNNVREQNESLKRWQTAMTTTKNEKLGVQQF